MAAYPRAAGGAAPGGHCSADGEASLAWGKKRPAYSAEGTLGKEATFNGTCPIHGISKRKDQRGVIAHLNLFVS